MDQQDSVPALRAMIVDLQNQVEDLKQDKRDLRADKDALKGDAAKLKDDLQGTIGEVLRLGQELQAAKSHQEELQAEIQRLEKRQAPERSSCATQTDAVPEVTLSDEIPEVSKMVAPENAPDALGIDFQIEEDRLTQTQEAYGADIDMGMTKRKIDSLEGGSATSEPPRKRGRPPKAGIIKLPARIPAPTPTASAPTTRASTKKSTQGHDAIAYKLDVAFILPDQDIASRLQDLPMIDASQLNIAAATREFLGDEYGGSACQFIQLVPAEHSPSGHPRVFAYPKPEDHPQMPLVPGASGVVLGHHCDRALDRGPTSVFSTSGLTRIYLGEYMWERVQSMSAEAFRGQRETVKEKWASEILGEIRCLGEVQTSQRARVALRKDGSLPQGNDGVDAELLKDELQRIKANNGRPVSKLDIIAAFERGEETVPVTRLRYLSYDTALAEDIETKYLVYQGGCKQAKRKTASTSKRSGKSPAKTLQSLHMGGGFPAYEQAELEHGHVEWGPSQEWKGEERFALGAEALQAGNDSYFPYGAGRSGELTFPQV